ncbi:MAG: oligopeptide transporter, OPT family [candidate division Zixibacteria bacterium]|nr:oligopeptide transporter, OPT family [candidate division Zixibacteria bacterium]
MSDDFKPYVPHHQSPAESTLKAVLIGIIFGALFGAANAYLGLTAGLTVSTSIPIAVMAAGFFKLIKSFGGKANILEANMSQTVGSASSSLVSGVIFTIPALYLWHLDPTYLEMVMLAFLGGILGVLFMIPLRRFLIVREHKNLPYPEGTACAEVLIVADKGGQQAGFVFRGLVIGALFKLCANFLAIWKEKIDYTFSIPNKANIGIKAAPALLGVGYILGLRISTVMVAGSFISWAIVIPIIASYGDQWGIFTLPENGQLISEMAPSAIWNKYIRYLGAGGVAVGGIITIIKSFPVMIDSIKLGLSKITNAAGEITHKRTERDLSFKFIGLAVIAIILMITLMPGIITTTQNIPVRLMAAVAIVIFAFLFVTVSSRIVGLVGVSSNPTSGMTIVTLLGTSLVFVALGFTGDLGKIAVLSVGTIVCVAASMAGDVSQDLKTGFLVGGTPRKQQLGELVGIITSVWAVCFSVIVLHEGFGFGSIDLPAPQATLMKTVIEGVLSADLPWNLVIAGGVFAIIVELIGLPSLPFAVGLYLPLTTMSPIFVGGLVKYFVDKKRNSKGKSGLDSGILFSSGLIAGEGLIGVGIAAFVYFFGKWDGLGFDWAGPLAKPLALVIFAGLVYILMKQAKSNNT